MPAEVTVWRVRLDLDGQRLAELRSHLNGAEREREARILRSEGRTRFAAARGQLREVLAEQLDASPSAIPIVSGRHGKPSLDPATGRELRFNVSHSHDRALIALAEGLEVGVDVECVDRSRDLEAIARRVMSPAELRAWGALSDAELRTTAFFDTWTRKEAYAKGRGEGLLVAFDHLDLEPLSGARWRVRGEEAGGSAWTIAAVELGSGYRGAVAAEAEDFEVVERDRAPTAAP